MTSSITLTRAERTAIDQALGSDEVADKRLRVLLLVDEGRFGPGLSKQRAAKEVGVDVTTVDSVLRNYPKMGLEFIKKPRRPGRRKLSFEQQREMVKLLDNAPPEGAHRWTYQLLASELVRRGLIDSITRETVRRLLRELGISLADVPTRGSKPT